MSKGPRHARFVVGLLIVSLASTHSPGAAETRSLTLEDRIAAQRAIEQVYWNHRIWPRENRQAKPPLSAVLSDPALRARVEDTLRKSNALDKYWHRPITGEQLQAELDRMAAHTRDPQLLEELFTALGNDPRLIAETLARQSLADRLIHHWYVNDERFHGELKKRAEGALDTCPDVGCMRWLDVEYRETTWRLRSEGAEASEGGPHEDAVYLDAREWRSHLARLAETLGGKADSLPPLKLSGLQETPQAFVATAVLSQDWDGVRTATSIWPKVSFDEWWGAERAALSSHVPDSARLFTLPATDSSGCVADSWTREGLDTRTFHTAVWTGTEMIVWGGHDGRGSTNTGGRYDPATDSWTPTSAGANVPGARWDHSAVWTGTEMIVWGGIGAGILKTGGRYDPATDSWTTTSMGTNVPAGRYNHTAVWTGTAMIVWGGSAAGVLNTGGRYDPATDSWTPTSTGANVPEARTDHTAVWSGAQMIVWGGSNGGGLSTGGRYDPAADSWTPTSTGTNVPDARYFHSAVWTGTEMIVWGGSAGTTLNTGGRYNPATDSWTPTSTGANVPLARSRHTGVWTGAEMIVWGDSNGGDLSTGGRYDPATDSWTPTSTGTNVAARILHTAVWTGTEMIVWGGTSGTVLNTGGRYDPATDSWTPTSTPPLARILHTAVWTGAEMIVWGGYDYAFSLLNTGGRYDPATDSWSPTSAGTNVPEARTLHTAVWTGTEMIVWGGSAGTTLNTGGRYDPATDSWTPTSTGANVPLSREQHTAVWTGTEMIVWGGIWAGNSGGRYDPATDSWTPTSTGTNVPTGGTGHIAVWTGTEMIVWGSASAGNSGGRYDPATDSWTPTSMGANVPAGRYDHTAVWTGTEMIVWGGYDGTSPDTNTGGRYDPTTDSWTPTSMGTNVPDARELHTAVWTGTQMIAWGGRGGGFLTTGGLYCACPSGTLYYRDADGDGFGDPSVTGTACDGAIPAGHVANRDDCNDASASINPGAVELCSNNTDDDCDGAIDNAAPPGPVASVTMRNDVPAIVWAAFASAQAYDVVYGDLGLLHASGGDFTAATQGCVAYQTPLTSTMFGPTPGVGQGYWLLVRGDNCAGAGTYDSGDPAQVGSRDAEIEASGLSCTQSVCGDGACNGSEDGSNCPADCGVSACTVDAECQPASCCNATSCITIWEPQWCSPGGCSDGCSICLSSCSCQAGECVAVF